MNSRCPTDPPYGATVTAVSRASPSVGDGVPGHHLDTRLPSALRPLSRCGAGVDDRHDVHARRGEVQRCRVGAVVGGEDDRVAAGQHTVAVDVGAGRGGEHHAGAVVVRERQRALVGAGGQDDATRADAPDALAGDVLGGVGTEVVGTAFDGEEVVVVVVAEDGGTAQDAHLGGGVELPGDAAHPVEVFGRAQEAAAQFRLVVGEDDTGSAAGGGGRRGEAGRSRADDQQVAVGVYGVVAGGVRFGGEASLAGEAARDQAVVELDGGRGEHRLGEGRLDLDDRVGLLHTGREDAPRGRPSLMLVPASMTPLARRAEARVSPRWPWYSVPSKVKVRGVPRWIRPRVGWRNGWPAAEPLMVAAPPPPLLVPS